ncbi:MAG: N-6 DNA methylase [Bifidobacteriaceae bacterium]|jgi:hypothetical protein|nr:N-6 DNA methylase [Bifidobacteriaceae bacterium]
MTQWASGWLGEAVSQFGAACAVKLAGPGDREAAIRSPLEALLARVGANLGRKATFYDEVRDDARRIRPDYAVAVDGAVTGYVEVKAPGKGLDPAALTGHDAEQWARLRDLPNLLCTNGAEWRLWVDGQPWGEPVAFGGGRLEDAGAALVAPDEFLTMMTAFLKWAPAPITSVGALVRAVAPLTRLLRGQVMDRLVQESLLAEDHAAPAARPFTGLARDWRALLFPDAPDRVFADGYAQAVTFALLLARSDGIDLTAWSLHEVGNRLGGRHSLMGRALQVLTSDVAKSFAASLGTLVRVVGAVDWGRVRRRSRDAYLYLYEHFLDAYDSRLRKESGTYYTPLPVVDHMVRLTEEALRSKLGRGRGFADPDVLTVDPSMGTGTYLVSVLERIAAQTGGADGPGAVAEVLAEAAGRLVGFELQLGPYAVAELRAQESLAAHGAGPDQAGPDQAEPDQAGPNQADGRPSPAAPRLFVADTLSNPDAADQHLAQWLEPIAMSRRGANRVKRKANVTVVIGNPPYREHAEGLGGWVENGSKGLGPKAPAILDDFQDPASSRHAHNLKNLYVYFWRWATWKVWESTPADADAGDAGAVCFITPSSYLAGPGFSGMRAYLRRWASDGWVIDLTPEGQTPDVPTRVFRGVRQPLAIGLFVRRAGASREIPADIWHRALSGARDDKFAQLGRLTLADDGWAPARAGWTDPFLPAPAGEWDAWPALGDLMAWASPGVTGNRRWPFAPSREILGRRWAALGAADDADRPALFKETTDRSLAGAPPPPLPGVADAPTGPVGRADGPVPRPIRIGYRAFDRQWVIPDARLLDRPRHALWRARCDRQVFVVEQHAHPIDDGPGLVVTALIPELHHFNNRGGRVLPLFNPDGSANLAPGLAKALSRCLGRQVQAAQVLAYTVGVVAHPAYTRSFARQLATPGVRVPLTADAALWDEAVALGEWSIWSQTYGERFADPEQGRPAGDIRLPRSDPRRPLNTVSIGHGPGCLPQALAYDPRTEILRLGPGEFAPVAPAVWEYAVGGRPVIRSWFNYRKAEPGGRKSSPLDRVHCDTWPAEWTTELIDLLSLLGRLVELAGPQRELLRRIVAGPLLTKTDLAAAGASWPRAGAARRPPWAGPAGDAACLDLG